MNDRKNVRRLFVGLAVAGGMLIVGVGTAAAANMVRLYRSGVWSVLYTPSSNNGSPMCILVDDIGPSTYFALKFQGGSHPALFGELGKASWSIPNGRSIAMDFRVDRDPIFHVSADGSGRLVQWLVVGNGTRRFIRDFKDGETLLVDFPDGDEPTWRISLDGSYKATGVFSRCIAHMPSSTEPYGKSGAQGAGPGWNGPTG